MKIGRNFKLLCFLNVYITIFAVNHWVLSDNGKILQKIDSPFYMKEPNNLIAFLDQIKHNNIVESTYLKLLRQREIMAREINFSIQFGMDVIEKANCALKSYEIKNPLKFTKITKNYLERISLKKFYELQNNINDTRTVKLSNNDNSKLTEPICSNFINISSGICCYDHLDSLHNINKLHIDPEMDLKDIELEFDSKTYVKNLIVGLKINPNSWKYHTLSSFYWRMKGNAIKAIECAKIGLMLAPSKFRDIPLLSLGTILLHLSKLQDALILIISAVDHAPYIPENHYALGIINAMLDNYNYSIKHLTEAEKLDSSLTSKIKELKEFINCHEVINRKTSKMNSYVEFIKNEVNGLRDMKNKIVSSHEKLLQQQVPLGSRYYSEDNDIINRGQYCSTKTMSDTNEPVLFCDFYSDLQMRLESKNFDIDLLENELNINNEAIIKRLSVGLQTQFKFNKNKNKKPS